MTQKRFDLGSSSRFQSRLGALDKGGQIRNGFTEVRPNKEVWSWQRPALTSGTAAPFSGSILGMFLFGTTLYGLAVQTGGGTATSYNVYRGGGGTSILLFTGDVADGGAEPPDALLQMLSATPGTWNGAPFNSIQAGTTTGVAFTTLALSGSRASNFFIAISAQGGTLSVSSASYGFSFGITRWGWPSALLSGTGVSAGTFYY